MASCHIPSEAEPNSCDTGSWSHHPKYLTLEWKKKTEHWDWCFCSFTLCQHTPSAGYVKKKKERDTVPSKGMKWFVMCNHTMTSENPLFWRALLQVVLCLYVIYRLQLWKLYTFANIPCRQTFCSAKIHDVTGDEWRYYFKSEWKSIHTKTQKLEWHPDTLTFHIYLSIRWIGCVIL